MPKSEAPSKLKYKRVSRSGKPTLIQPTTRDLSTAPDAHNPAEGMTVYQHRLMLAANSSPTKPLTEQQRAYAKHRGQGESIHSAAALAGYAGKPAAYQAEQMPAVKALIAKEQAAYEQASQMTRKRVMDGFLDSIEMAKLMAEPATMVSGWREIAKMCGYFAPVEKKITLDVDGGRARMERMSDAELEALVGQAIPPDILEDLHDEHED